ncbi:LOW QUALITY PROTEIN: thyrotroph embryonic factor related [Schistosoma mansoni]|uniref:thyrotroph embryonic factor related n=1 Tax=Schistosoma mansoni TaxID=6183 RepID=UPI00022DCC4A|nr:LOW QUALITY PROTEIN: thyrotroph embryonic factor related [Schistosoma mansoni]|eukprot:XP_018655573.1 LOW QUALITY PROTEIN: thyrotroph embryonic factor related [Schistosoma mansoni]
MMQVPFEGTSLDLHSNLQIRDACQLNTQVGGFQNIHPSFSSCIYPSLEQTINSVNTDAFKKEYTYDTELQRQILPSLTLNNFGLHHSASSPLNPMPPITYSPGVCSHPYLHQTFSNSDSPSASNDVQDHMICPDIKRRNRGRSSRLNFTSSSPGIDDKPVSLSTKDSQISSSDCNSDCSTVTRSSEKMKPSDKDDRYIQRRLKNNLAAKRSRDNRKRREDTIALRASYLEKSTWYYKLKYLKREVCLLRGIPFDPNYKVRVFNDNYLSSCQTTPQSTVSTDFSNECPLPDFSPIACSNQTLNSNVPYPPITEFSGNCG